MKRTKLLIVPCALAAVLILCSGFGAFSQTGTYPTINPKGKKASSPPISDYTLTFEITLDSGKSAKVLVREGEMAKIGDLNQGYAFALVPVVKDKVKKTATFNIFALTQDENANEMVRELQRLDARLEAVVATDTQPEFLIRLISVDPPPSASLEQDDGLELTAQYQCSPSLDCCLACDDGVWVCAICGWRYCGCCCDPPRSCETQPTH